MGMTVKGYVVEPPRIGASNSPYTFTPSVVVLDQTAFDTHFPTDESAPRVEYFVTVVPDGLPDEDRFLVNAEFGWSKNEGTTTRAFDRFDYDSSAQSFKLLPGGRAEFIGLIDPNINTDGIRLSIPVPIEGLSSAPYRLSYGEIGGGTTLTLVLVDSFGSPAAGTVECMRSSGDLNWNAADLTGLEGQLVRFQRQPFYQFVDSDGAIGFVSEATTPGLVLNPLPATGQFPMLRFGHGIWLTPVEVADDTSFTTVPAGTVQWSRTSGLLKFNSLDLAASLLAVVYYDGVFIQYGVKLPRQALGLVSSPANLTTVPPFGPGEQRGDMIFYLPDDDGYQYETAVIVDDLDDNDAPSGSVLVKKSTGEVRFPWGNGDKEVTFVSGDLPLEYGLGMRFYRNVVNPTASSPTPGDLSLYWRQVGENISTLAKPIPAAPFISLPALPVTDADLDFDITVQVVEGTGTFVGELKDLSVPTDISGPTPPTGFGYVLSYPDKQLKFARRRNGSKLLLPRAVSAFALPDPVILGTNYLFELESAPGTDSYTTLTEGLDYLLDPDPGILTLTNTVGEVVGSGTQGSLAGDIFQDASSTLTTELGDVLVVPSGPAQGVYRLAAGSLAAGVQTDLDTDHHVTESGFSYEVRRGPEVVADRYWKDLTFPDTNTRIERIRALGPIQNAVSIMAGTGVFTDPSTLESPAADFVAADVQLGDTLTLTSGPDSGKSFTILSVGTTFLMLAGSVTDLSATPKVFTIERRLRIDGADPTTLRFRFGQTTFTVSGSTVAVASDIAFLPNLPSGTVEYSLATGNLNFSPLDIPPTDPPIAYAVNLLSPGIDYTLQPSLGFIDFTERFLTGEEAIVTYIPLDENGAKMAVTTERVTFTILKELTTPTPRDSVTSVLFFNPDGLTVASNPLPRVYRGGRPQTVSTTPNNGSVVVSIGTGSNLYLPNVILDIEESKLTFQPNVGFMTDALPSGANVNPDERVYVDYDVYEAIGGEKSVTLLHPLYIAQVVLTEDATSFTVEGNHVAKFDAGVFRAGDTAIYEVASAVYPNPALPLNTLVTLKPGQRFLENLTDPEMNILSLTPYATAFRPAFFEAEINPYQIIPRGMNRIKVMGNRTQTYAAGVLLLFTDNATFYDYHLVVSSQFNGVWTEIQLGSNAQRQHAPGTSLLKYTVRVVLNDGVTRTQTLRTPILSQPYGVFRKPVGQAGQVLDEGYSLDDAGVLTYDEPIAEGEEVAVWYTGNQYTTPGVYLRSHYTHGIVPEGPDVLKSNGLLGQTLLMEYTLWNPDTFFFRVETLTNFRAEVADYFREQAQGSSPSSGPRTSNAPGSPGLAGQGRESLFYQEMHISNMDLVARRFLKYLNDSTNHLEDTLQSIDGRRVGAYRRRFRFDGKTDNPPHTTYSAVTNDIDDRVLTKYNVEFSWAFPFFTFVPQYDPLWKPSALSRLYPTYKDTIFNVTFAGNDTPDIVSGTPILQFDQTQIDSVSDPLFRRYPRALVLETAAAGATVLTVDNSTGTEVFYRPAFKAGMKVDFQNANGQTILSAQAVAVDPIAPIQNITLTAGLSIEIPRGTTVVLNTDDPPDPSNPLIYQNNYSTFWDVSFDKTNGTILYSEPWFGAGNTPKTGEILQLDGVVIRSTATAPDRFPALDGVAASDSGDIGIPVSNRTLDCELTYLGDEATAITNLLLDTTATDPQGNVSLDATRTILTRTTSWATPVPQVFDLVRFTTGANQYAGWRRIVAVNLAAKTVTVDEPLPTQEANQTVLITAAPALASGTAIFAGDTSIVLAGTSFKVGQTIIFTGATNPNYGVRRQITGNPAPNTWTLDHPVTYPAPVSTFRTSNHLSTYSGFTTAVGASENVLHTVLTNDGPSGGVDAQVLGIERFFDGNPAKGTDGILTDLLPSPTTRTGTVVAGDPTLTGTGVDFLAANIAPNNLAYIDTGANRGFYTIQDVTNTTLTVDPVFPVSGSVQYRVVAAYGVQVEGLNDLHGVLSDCRDWATATQTWIDRLEYQDLVVLPGGPDSDVYANDLLTDDLVARSNAASDRQAVLASPTGPTFRIGLTLGERDGYYNKRYIWIDGRVNVQKGLLYMAGRAANTRVTNLAQQKNDLIKLASME